MNILLAGGTGFIGGHLIEALLKENHHIFLLTRKKPNTLTNIPSGITPLHWDGKALDKWAEFVSQTDAVINLAGENIGGKNLFEVLTKRWNSETKNNLRESRINAGKVLSEAIHTSPQRPSLFIQASAVGYYGDRSDEILTEKSPPGSDFLAKLCIDWENSTSSVEEMGIRRVILRIAGVVMSSKGGSLPIIMLPYKFFVGGPLGNGQQWMSWIHIHDLVKGILYFLYQPNSSGPYNLCAPNPLKNKDLSRIIGKSLSRPSFFPVPKIAFKIVLGEKAGILLASQRQIPERLMQHGFSYDFANAQEAIKDIIQNKH